MLLRAWSLSGLYREFSTDLCICQTIALLGASKQEVRRFCGLQARHAATATIGTCHWA